VRRAPPWTVSPLDCVTVSRTADPASRSLPTQVSRGNSRCPARREGKQQEQENKIGRGVRLAKQKHKETERRTNVADGNSVGSAGGVDEDTEGTEGPVLDVDAHAVGCVVGALPQVDVCVQRSAVCLHEDVDALNVGVGERPGPERPALDSGRDRSVPDPLDAPHVPHRPGGAKVPWRSGAGPGGSTARALDGAKARLQGPLPVGQGREPPLDSLLEGAL
jgi:hypothetical protein